MPGFIPARAAVINGRVAEFVLNIQDDTVLGYNGARLQWKGVPTPAPEVHSNYVVYKIPTHGPHFVIVEQADRHTLLPSNVGVVTAADGGCAFFDMSYP